MRHGLPVGRGGRGGEGLVVVFSSPVQVLRFEPHRWRRTPTWGLDLTDGTAVFFASLLCGFPCAARTGWRRVGEVLTPDAAVGWESMNGMDKPIVCAFGVPLNAVVSILSLLLSMSTLTIGDGSKGRLPCEASRWTDEDEMSLPRFPSPLILVSPGSGPGLHRSASGVSFPERVYALPVIGSVASRFCPAPNPGDSP